MIYLSKEEFDAAMVKVMTKLKELDDKIELIKSNQELQIKTAGKKKVK